MICICSWSCLRGAVSGTRSTSRSADGELCRQSPQGWRSETNLKPNTSNSPCNPTETIMYTYMFIYYLVTYLHFWKKLKRSYPSVGSRSWWQICSRKSAETQSYQEWNMASAALMKSISEAQVKGWKKDGHVVLPFYCSTFPYQDCDLIIWATNSSQPVIVTD